MTIKITDDMVERARRAIINEIAEFIKRREEWVLGGNADRVARAALEAALCQDGEAAQRRRKALVLQISAHVNQIAQCQADIEKIDRELAAIPDAGKFEASQELDGILQQVK